MLFLQPARRVVGQQSPGDTLNQAVAIGDCNELAGPQHVFKCLGHTVCQQGLLAVPARSRGQNLSKHVFSASQTLVLEQAD